MLANGESGYWNATCSNEGEINEVVATNPCGERSRFLRQVRACSAT